jgi:hypothetical protein
MAGHISIASAEVVARSARNDGAASPALQSFCSLGAEGARPQNIERDLHRWLGGPNHSCHGFNTEPYMLDVVACPQSSGAPERMQIPFLPPHETLHQITQNGLADICLGKTERSEVRRFWQHCKSLQEYRDHGGLQNGSLAEITPLIFHVDGAEVYKNAEFYIYSWSTPFADGDVIDSKHLICLIPYEIMRDDKIRANILRRVAKAIAWSCDAASKGKFPTTGVDGEPLSGWRQQQQGTDCAKGAFLLFKSDAKARKEVHEHERYYRCTLICNLCCTTQPGKRRDPAFFFTNFSDSQLWTETAIDPRAIPKSPWSDVVGYHPWAITFDLMHSSELGVARDVCAGTIVLWLVGSLNCSTNRCN